MKKKIVLKSPKYHINDRLSRDFSLNLKVENSVGYMLIKPIYSEKFQWKI